MPATARRTAAPVEVRPMVGGGNFHHLARNANTPGGRAYWARYVDRIENPAPVIEAPAPAPRRRTRKAVALTVVPTPEAAGQ